MTPEKMRAKSAAKVKQVLELMKVLQIKAEARERISQDGFIENVVFYVDYEEYPAPAPEPEEKPAEQAPAPETEEKK